MRRKNISNSEPKLESGVIEKPQTLGGEVAIDVSLVKIVRTKLNRSNRLRQTGITDWTTDNTQTDWTTDQPGEPWERYY